MSETITRPATIRLEMTPAEAQALLIMLVYGLDAVPRTDDERLFAVSLRLGKLLQPPLRG